ncbi:MAG: AMP-binding protein [Rothia sp. (in: high G+C Gram-positive bacteria)]|nr:AMP-binding protein [Rothia sp. (in: high G+C Gram-positive bacteria)]
MSSTFLTLSAQHMRPCAAPTELSEHTVEVGADRQPRISKILSHFLKKLLSPSDAPALTVRTSGSTGMPKQTVLSSRALAASGHATEAFVGVKNAQWMLALPVHYVAGAQVLARSVLAGTTPVVTDSIARGSSFNALDFLRTCERMSSNHRMLSLVPTQLHMLLEAAEHTPEVLDALATFNGILLGGAPSSAALLNNAEQAHLQVLTTYGSAETSGGCVYNGIPLPGITVGFEPSSQDDGAPARIWLGGAPIASGYLNNQPRTQQHFFIDDVGTPWYRTDDLGQVAENRLTVAGRDDDLIITGGVKVSPAPIATKLEEHPVVREAFVCGVPDPKWGQAAVAAVNVRSSSANLHAELTALASKLEPVQRPKHLLILPEFPVLSTGKPDRQKLQQMLASSYGS